MTDLRKSMLLKTAAFILSFLCFVLTSVFVLGCVFMAEIGAYTTPKYAVINNRLEGTAMNYAHEVASYYAAYIETGRTPDEVSGAFDGYNFFFELTDETGKHIVGNNTGENYRFYVDYSYTYYHYVYDNSASSEEKSEYFPEGYYSESHSQELTDPEAHEANVRLYVKENFAYTDKLSVEEYLIIFLYDIKYTAIFTGIISFFAGIILYVYLLCAVGHKKGYDGATPGFFDKIPFDILTSAAAALFIFELMIIDNVYTGFMFYGLIAVFFVIDIAFAMGYFLTFANRLKTATFIKNNLTVIAVKFIIRLLKKISSLFTRFIGKLPLIWKTVVAILAYSMAELILYAILWRDSDVYIFFWISGRAAVSAFILYIVVFMKKLKIGGREIAEGNLGYKVNTDRMFGEFKEHGITLNNIGMGLSAAVDEKMKSERMKTELITNVSHDIKTPLTSIVNYVDLLKKENIDNDTAVGYIEVLERQSARLKKLLEDLVEASKASTGNLAVNAENLEIGVLLDQTVGEYKEKAEKVNLKLLLTKPEEPVIIRADGRHMWRIFDNLMNNICKYAQEYTRVYMSLEKRDGRAIVVFKNISKYPLNISSDELMERFVRGDRSRNMEGSGLGLSIARSLTELQGGKMNLFVDGDLFKAVLTFDSI